MNKVINWGGLIPTERRSCYICGRTEEELTDLLKEAMWNHERNTKEKHDFIDIKTAQIFSDLDFPTIKIEMVDRKERRNKADVTFRFPLCPICKMIYLEEK
jgi:hypothetical protein